jgi:hypothetical protein
MDIEAMVQDIDESIRRLEKVRALLTGHTAPLKRGRPPIEAERRGASKDSGSTEEQMG